MLEFLWLGLLDRKFTDRTSPEKLADQHYHSVGEPPSVERLRRSDPRLLDCPTSPSIVKHENGFRPNVARFLAVVPVEMEEGFVNGASCELFVQATGECAPPARFDVCEWSVVK